MLAYDYCGCALGQPVRQASALTHERGHASPQIVMPIAVVCLYAGSPASARASRLSAFSDELPTRRCMSAFLDSRPTRSAKRHADDVNPGSKTTAESKPAGANPHALFSGGGHEWSLIPGRLTPLPAGKGGRGGTDGRVWHPAGAAVGPAHRREAFEASLNRARRRRSVSPEAQQRRPDGRYRSASTYDNPKDLPVQQSHPVTDESSHIEADLAEEWQQMPIVVPEPLHAIKQTPDAAEKPSASFRLIQKAIEGECTGAELLLVLTALVSIVVAALIVGCIYSEYADTPPPAPPSDLQPQQSEGLWEWLQHA